MNIDLGVTIYKLQKSKIVHRYSIFGLSCHLNPLCPLFTPGLPSRNDNLFLYFFNSCQFFTAKLL